MYSQKIACKSAEQEKAASVDNDRSKKYEADAR